MDQYFAIGQRLKLQLSHTTEEDAVCGRFHSFSPDKTRITITDVTFSDNTLVAGQMHFFRNEIENIVAESCEDELKAFVDPHVGRSLAYCKGPSHPHLSYMFNQPERGQPKSDRKLRPEYKMCKAKYEKFTIVDSVDGTFEQAVCAIAASKIIGVSMEGAQLGRYGEIFWINIFCDATSYLFDVKTIGMHGRLVKILEAKDITKIFHDARLVADCLFHKHNIKMTNIIDTQVFDLMIVRARRDNCPSYVSSLNDCLKRYLKVPDAVLLTPVIWEEKIKDEMAKWASRPLPELAVEVAVQNVAFLTDLHKKMKLEYFEPVKFGSEFYLKHVVSMNNEDAKKYNSLDHLTPRQLYWICRNRDSNANQPDNKVVQ